MSLKIIGTSHIARQSLLEIKKAFADYDPDIVALELDRARAISLLQGESRRVSLREISRIGVRGYVFVKVGQYIQQKLGRLVGVAPGSEMKTALQLAAEKKKEVQLIDQPIHITLKKFSKELTWREKGWFFSELLLGLFSGKKQLQKYGLEQLDLTKVPEETVIRKMIGHLQERYPSVYKTLIEDRNKYMVRRLQRLEQAHPGKKILVVVGAGHKEGMERLLQERNDYK